MKRHVEHILDVVRTIRDLSQQHPNWLASDLRIRATRQVARDHRVGRTTVQAAYTRYLNCDASSFDHLVRTWLQNGSSDLRNKLCSAFASSDRDRIDRFFTSKLIQVDLDADLAEVFPDSKAINQALRDLLTLVQKYPVATR